MQLTGCDYGNDMMRATQRSDMSVPVVHSLYCGNTERLCTLIMAENKLRVYFVYLVINNGNWKKLEDAVRAYAENRKKNILIYTGVYGHLQLKSKTDGNIYSISYPELVSPVPSHFWKVVIDEDLEASVAFVMSNNPYLDKTSPSHDLLCTTTCSYLATVKGTIEKGLVTCCSYSSLASKITNIPALPAGVSNNLYDSSNGEAIQFGNDLKAAFS